MQRQQQVLLRCSAYAGFPVAHPVDTAWIEDEMTRVNNRYGHRSGVFFRPQSFDQLWIQAEKEIKHLDIFMHY
jgi:hypothetical protein